MIVGQLNKEIEFRMHYVRLVRPTNKSNPGQDKEVGPWNFPSPYNMGQMGEVAKDSVSAWGGL